MVFLPEGCGGAVISDMQQLLDAAANKRICKANALLCDRDHNIIVDLGFIKGVIPRQEGAFSPFGEVKDIAVISRVGKPICFTVKGIAHDSSSVAYALLSRREAMQICFDNYVSALQKGDVICGRVTRTDSFGAFVDIGCGLVALLPIDAISVSRISHPADRFYVGQDIMAVISDISPEGRVSLTHKELLGTWEENAAPFEVGQTVSGIVRSVEDYGVFVELTPNLAGLAEPSEVAVCGECVSVYIKSIIPEKMKIKLVIIDKATCLPHPASFSYPQVTHINYWRYSPANSKKVVESDFTVQRDL